MGVGTALQEPCLQDGQYLDGARISRLFYQKILWLRPEQILPDAISDCDKVRNFTVCYLFLKPSFCIFSNLQGHQDGPGLRVRGGEKAPGGGTFLYHTLLTLGHPLLCTSKSVFRILVGPWA